MAHFAKIDENNIVQQVVAVHNNEAPTEEAGKLFLESVYKDGATWLQTSYNTHRSMHYTNGEVSTDQTKAFRGNLASEGSTWDPINEIFMPPKPFPSWSLDNAVAKWTSPRGDAPDLSEQQISDNYLYVWDEENTEWDLTQTPNINSA
tara:strand:- start:239 stop:682 length:444 start_codon:yes stop_codon:yes gene_type:complete